MSSNVYLNNTLEDKAFEKISRIKEVFKENFVEEMHKISKLIERYNHISMDTEFQEL